MNTKVITVMTFVFIFAVSLRRATVFPEGDIFWGARNGIDILHHGLHIFQPDTWNLLTLGEEWSPNSWLWNVVLGGAFLAFGNYGFLVVTLITNIAAFVFLWGYLQKLRMPPLAAFLTLIASLAIITMFMNGRSNTADFLILTAFLYLGKHFLQRFIPLLIIAFVLTVLWLNLHLTGIAAAVVFPAVIYAMLHQENIKTRFIKAFAVLLSVLVAFPLTPYGFSGLIKVSMVQNESKGLITEWSNVFSLPGANFGILFLLAVSLVICYAIFRQKQFLYGFLTVALIYGTYDTIRLTPFLLTIILGAFVFWEGKSIVLHPRIVGLSVPVSWMLVGVTLITSALGGISGTKALVNPENMFYITGKELSLIPQNSRAAVTQDAGSAIIFFRPDVLVTMDGRNDLIGAKRFVEAANILYSDDSAEVEKWLKAHDINTVFVEDSTASGADIIQKNMTELGWELRTNETRAVVYIKR